MSFWTIHRDIITDKVSDNTIMQTLNIFIHNERIHDGKKE